MPFCKNCGVQLEDSAKFCSNCGTPCTQHTIEENIELELEVPIQEIISVPQPQKSSGKLNIAQFVWGIINILCCCGMPLGIAALVFTIIAHDAKNAEEESKKLKIAKICNIIATVIDAVTILFYILLYIVVILLAVGTV